MAKSSNKSKRVQVAFGWVFVFSSILSILTSFLFFFHTSYQTVNGFSGVSTAASVNVISLIALLVSISSLIGFVLTSVLSIRRELRDENNYKLDIEKKTLEIEKLKLELEEAKKQQN
jgi:hypothetical protein